jgi:hypothetical protein
MTDSTANSEHQELKNLLLCKSNRANPYVRTLKLTGTQYNLWLYLWSTILRRSMGRYSTTHEIANYLKVDLER